MFQKTFFLSFVVFIPRVPSFGFLHISLSYINLPLAIFQVITIPITFSNVKSNFFLGFYLSSSIPVFRYYILVIVLVAFQSFSIVFEY